MSLSLIGSTKPLIAACCSVMALSAHHSADWSVAYNGGGSVQLNSSGVRLTPLSSQKTDETHAALVLSKVRNIKYFDLDLKFTNLKPLRVGTPNPWESFWLFFNYQPDGSHKRTNYIAFKPNGIEVGVATGDRDQKILKTWTESKCAFGVPEHARVRRMGTRLTIAINDHEELLFDFAKDADKPLSQLGVIGLYSEDADVKIDAISVRGI